MTLGGPIEGHDIGQLLGRGGAGVSSLGLDDKLPTAPSEEEKKSILDLFKR